MGQSQSNKVAPAGVGDEESRETEQRQKMMMIGGGCCCCLATIGIIIGIVVAVSGGAPQGIEEVGICYVNACGHTEGSAVLAEYGRGDFSSAKDMSKDCAKSLKDANDAGEALKVYIGVRFRNPNEIAAKVSSMSISFSRVAGGSSKDAPTGDLFSCQILDMEIGPGENLLQIECKAEAAAKARISKTIDDFQKCREVAVGQDIASTITVADVSVPLSFDTTSTLNPGSVCPAQTASDEGGGGDGGGESSASGGEAGFLGGDPSSCKGTTDVHLDLPTAWLCSVDIGKDTLDKAKKCMVGTNPRACWGMLRETSIGVEIDMYNPVSIGVSVIVTELHIYHGVDADLIASVNESAPLVVKAASTVKLFVQGSVIHPSSLEKAMKLMNLPNEKVLHIEGKLRIEVLGFEFNVAIPRTTIDLTSHPSTIPTKSTLMDKLDTAKQVYDFMVGRCICVYNCDSFKKSTSATIADAKAKAKDVVDGGTDSKDSKAPSPTPKPALPAPAPKPAAAASSGVCCTPNVKLGKNSPKCTDVEKAEECAVDCKDPPCAEEGDFKGHESGKCSSAALMLTRCTYFRPNRKCSDDGGLDGNVCT